LGSPAYIMPFLSLAIAHLIVASGK
jgi:hypothetical protein